MRSYSFGERIRGKAAAMRPRSHCRRWVIALLIMILVSLMPSSRADTPRTAPPDWDLMQAGGSEAKLEVSPDQPGTVHVGIVKLAAEPMDWKIRLRRKAIQLEAGTSYLFTFQARADAPRQISVSLAEGKPPYANLGLFRNFDIGPKWRILQTRFTATASSNAAELFVNMGTNDVAVSVRGFTVEVAPDRGIHLSSADWKVVAIDAGTAEVYVSAETPGVVHLSLDKTIPSKDSWKVATMQGELNVEEGREYRLRFRARANSARSIRPSITQFKPPFGNLGLMQTCSLDTDWRHFSYRFQAKMTEKDAVLRFDVGDSTIDIELADVTLELLPQGTPPDPPKWELTVQSGCSAALVVAPENPGVTRVAIEKTQNVLMPWHIRVVLGGVKLRNGELYTFQIRARADEPRGIVCSINQGRSPFTNLGLYKLFTLTPEWETFQARFTPDSSGDYAQIEVNLGNSDIDVELGEVTLVAVETPEATPDRSRSTLLNISGVTFLLIVGGTVIFIRERARRKGIVSAH